MARTVQCIKLGQEAEGLDFPPYPGELGKRIWENVSNWLTASLGRLAKPGQTMLVSISPEPADARARQRIWPGRWKTTSLAAAQTPRGNGPVPPSA